MKISRITAILGINLILLIIIGCTSSPSLTPPLATPAITKITYTPSPIPSPIPTEMPQNIFHIEEYLISFEIPGGWSLEELEWIEMEGEPPRTAIVITKDVYEIILEYKTVFEDFWIGPRGMPAGDMFIQLEEVAIMDQMIPGYLLVYQGKDKILSYGIRTEELRISSQLRQNTDPALGYSYEDSELPEEIQDEYTAFIQTLKRTGTYELPESIALLGEFPVILPMEKSYYSQIFDTSVANACGPAAAMMVLDYFDLENSLETVINRLRTMDSPGAFDPDCYYNTVCTSPNALDLLLYEYGLNVHSHEYWTLPEVFSVVSKGNPIIADILWDEATASLGHFVVIYGVDLDQKQLFYHDPYRGSELTAYWDEFASLWEGRVDIGDPLGPEGHRFWGLEIRPPTELVP